jgi:hypothetical protein
MVPTMAKKPMILSGIFMGMFVILKILLLFIVLNPLVYRVIIRVSNSVLKARFL